MNTDAIASLSDQLMKVMQEIEELKKQRRSHGGYIITIKFQ
jgi:hypothetical protein